MNLCKGLILSLLIFVLPCRAGLYKSEADLTFRYGNPTLRKSGPYGSTNLRFSDREWLIQAWIVDNECQKIQYLKPTNPPPSHEEIIGYFRLNSDGSSWKRDPETTTLPPILHPMLGRNHLIREDGMGVGLSTSRGVTLCSAYWLMAVRENSKKNIPAVPKTPTAWRSKFKPVLEKNGKSEDNVQSPFSSFTHFVLGVLFILLLINKFLSRKQIRETSSQRKGRRGEENVKSILNRLDQKKYRIFHDIYLQRPDGRGTTQIDHIIISLYGIFVIETKNMSGWIFGTENQRKWTQVYPGKKYSLQNPLIQNSLHVSALIKTLNCQIDHTTIHNVVVFSGSAEFKTQMPRNVMKGKRLISFIRSHNRLLLCPSKVAQISSSLDQIFQDTDYNTIEESHIKSLNLIHHQSLKDSTKAP